MQSQKWNSLKILPTTFTSYSGMCFCLSRVNLFLIKFSENEKWNWWHWMVLPVSTSYWHWLVLGSEILLWSCLHSFKDSNEADVHLYRTVSTYPTVISKMLLPTELDTAMSPSPFRATMTLVIRSGMDVPAAKMVRPIISSLMPIVSPT